MKKVKKGDTVKVHVTEKEPDGSVIQTTENKEPLEIKLGEIDLLEGLQDAIVGMTPSEQKSVYLTPDKAYGEYQDDLKFEIKKRAAIQGCSFYLCIWFLFYVSKVTIATPGPRLIRKVFTPFLIFFKRSLLSFTSFLFTSRMMSPGRIPAIAATERPSTSITTTPCEAPSNEKFWAISAVILATVKPKSKGAFWPKYFLVSVGLIIRGSAGLSAI